MKKMPNKQKKFICKFCDFSSNKYSNYLQHLSTRKHINRTSLNKKPATCFKCENCNKVYKARNSLWYHKKSVFNSPCIGRKHHIGSTR